MSHLRKRYATNLILKRLKFSRVLTLQGARQTGKSVLVRDVIAKGLPKATYVTFDARALADFAQDRPDSFLAEHEDAAPLIIDEAQKAHHIFDAIKLVVDQAPRPGRYLLLGSTEFSHLSRVRESLTGRMARIRLYPLTIGETNNLPLREFNLKKLFLDHSRVNRAQLMKHIKFGGMPGMFSVRDDSERNRLFEDWIKLTCERDAKQFPDTKIDADLCLLVLEQIIKLDEPTAGNIAKTLKRDLRRIKTHLMVMETLFVINKISPHTAGTGKPIYYLLDVALAHFLGAPFYKCIETFIKTELDALISYHDAPLTKMTYFRSRAGGKIHFIIEDTSQMAAIKILDQESLDLREVEILKAFQKRKMAKPLHCYALCGARFSLKKENIEIFPWESVG